MKRPPTASSCDRGNGSSMSSIPRFPYTFNGFLLDPGNSEEKRKTSLPVEVGDGGQDVGDLAGDAGRGYSCANCLGPAPTNVPPSSAARPPPPRCPRRRAITSPPAAARPGSAPARPARPANRAPAPCPGCFGSGGWWPGYRCAVRRPAGPKCMVSIPSTSSRT